MRLSKPCPMPVDFSPHVSSCIAKNMLKGNVKFRMLRECALYFHGKCPCPNSSEYTEMARSLCVKYTQLQDLCPQNGEYWVK